jgi:hypothetical protein
MISDKPFLISKKQDWKRNSLPLFDWRKCAYAHLKERLKITLAKKEEKPMVAPFCSIDNEKQSSK